VILSVSTYRCDTLYTNVHCKSAGKVGRGERSDAQGRASSPLTEEKVKHKDVDHKCLRMSDVRVSADRRTSGCTMESSWQGEPVHLEGNEGWERRPGHTKHERFVHRLHKACNTPTQKNS